MKMKNGIVSRTLAVLTVALALSLVFAGCDNGNDTKPDKKPPKNISVTNTTGGGAVADPLKIDKDTQVSLTVSADRATAYSWDIKEGTDKVTLSAETGPTTTVTGVSVGTAKIVAYASNKDGSISKEITVEVKDDGLPNLTLKITDGSDTEITGTVNLNISDPAVPLKAVVAADNGSNVSDAVITWAANNTNVTLSANTGASVNVTGAVKGDAVITITATKSGYNPKTVTVNLTVKEDLQTNILFEWNKTPVWTSLSSGGSAANVFKATDYDDVVVRVYGATSTTDYPAVTADNGGIRLGGAGTSAPPRLVIGQPANAATATGDTKSTIKGDFDLAAGKVKVTVQYENLVAYATTDQYMLRIYVNNNSTGEANSFLGSASNIVTYRKSTSNSTTEGVQKLPNSATGTIEVIIDPDTIVTKRLALTTLTSTTDAEIREALSNAFICFHTQQSNAPPADNGLTITGIKIEYEGETVPLLPLTVIPTSTVLLDLNEEGDGDQTETLTASSTESGVNYSWAITSGSENVSLAPTTGTSVVVTGEAVGSAVITVTATKTGFRDNSATVNVTVIDTAVEGGPWSTTNLVLGGDIVKNDVKASITNQTSSTIMNIFAANNTTAWQTNAALSTNTAGIPFYIAIDLGESRKINKVTMNFNGTGFTGRLSNYYFAVSDNATTWAALKNNATNTAATGDASTFTEIAGTKVSGVAPWNAGWTPFISSAASFTAANNSFTTAHGNWQGTTAAEGRYVIVVGEISSSATSGGIPVYILEFAYEEEE
jgi:hypothetical protein